MHTLVEILLSNALLVVVFAIVAAGVTRLVRRPPVVHALWLLVLLKFVAPPIAPLSLGLPVDPAPRTTATVPLGDVLPSATSEPPAPLVQEPSIVRRVPPVVGHTAEAIDWSSVLAFIWLSGTVAWFVLAVVRMVRFELFLRAAREAPIELVAETRKISERLGLRSPPSLRVVGGRIPPSLWAMTRRPTIILPGPLLEGLDGEQQSTLLAHELAHLRRRDHWVRWLEFLVLGLYWWHPVAWWARRELQRAEEECCDAWVVSLVPRAREYADALLRTIDFLSSEHAALPPGASGIGPATQLKRRIAMIMNGRLQRNLSWGSRLAVALGALLVLPLALLSYPESDEVARLSPFTAVACEGSNADVEFEGRRYELVSINDLSAKNVLDYCKETYGELWEKRFAEDLVEVLDGMGHSTGSAVSLVLRNAGTRTEYVIPQATMTAENRQAIWRARNTNLRIPGRRQPASDVSPFTEVACEGDSADVEFEGRHYVLVSIDDLATENILTHCREEYGTLWEKRFAEDLVAVLDGMGHSPGETVKLVLRDPDTARETTIERASMTRTNRRAVWSARNRQLRGDKLSPFEAVQFHSDEVHVQFVGRFYQLISIDDLKTKEILDYSRNVYGKLGEKRFAEDLVTVLDGMGHSPGDTVKLVLDLETGRETVVADAPMTRANRQAVKRAHNTLWALSGSWVREGGDNVLSFSADGTLRVIDPGQGELRCSFTVGQSEILLHGVPEEYVGKEFPASSFSLAFSLDPEGALLLGDGKNPSRYLRKPPR